MQKSLIVRLASGMARPLNSNLTRPRPTTVTCSSHYAKLPFNASSTSSLLGKKTRQSAIRRRPHPPPAAAAATAPSVGVLVRVATGVPLVELFQSMTVAEAGIRSLALIIGTTLLVVLGNKTITFMCNGLSKAIDPEDTPTDSTAVDLLSDAIRAAERPSSVVLPFFGAAFCSTVIAAFGEVALMKLDVSEKTMAWGGKAIGILREAAQLLQDTSEILIIVFA